MNTLVYTFCDWLTTLSTFKASLFRVSVFVDDYTCLTSCLICGGGGGGVLWLRKAKRQHSLTGLDKSSIYDSASLHRFTPPGWLTAPSGPQTWFSFIRPGKMIVKKANWHKVAVIFLKLSFVNIWLLGLLYSFIFYWTSWLLIEIRTPVTSGQHWHC